MAKKRLEILTDVDRTAINKRIDDISTEYVFGFEETFVATANQVEFTLSKEFDKGMQAVELYINGVKQSSSFFTEISNKTIKTKKPIAQGDIVNIKAYKSKKTTEVKVIEHKDSHISGNDQLPVATESTKGLMAPEDKKKIKAVDMKADSALEKIAEHDTEIGNLKHSVSDGKKKVSVAITDKGVETAPDATFDIMATNISKIETDPSIGTTNAVAGDLLEGKKMVSQGELMTGAMPDNGALSKTITTQNGKQIITPGYYSGGEVKAQFNNLVPENVKHGIIIGGVAGNVGKIVQSKTNIPNAIKLKDFISTLRYDYQANFTKKKKSIIEIKLPNIHDLEEIIFQFARTGSGKPSASSHERTGFDIIIKNLNTQCKKEYSMSILEDSSYNVNWAPDIKDNPGDIFRIEITNKNMPSVYFSYNFGLSDVIIKNIYVENIPAPDLEIIEYTEE